MPANKDNRKAVVVQRIAKRPDEPPIIDGTYEGTFNLYGYYNGTGIPLERPLVGTSSVKYKTNGRFVEMDISPFERQHNLFGVWEVNSDHYGRKHWQLQVVDTDNDNDHFTINPTKIVNRIVTEYDFVAVEKGYMTGNSNQAPSVVYGSSRRVDN